jgi:hypothetical protein
MGTRDEGHAAIARVARRPGQPDGDLLQLRIPERFVPMPGRVGADRCRLEKGDVALKAGPNQAHACHRSRS